MVDLKELKKAGYSQDTLKAKFSQENPDEKTKNFINIHSGRIQDGVQHSLDMSRFFYAIDKAYDVPQQQVTYSLVRGLTNGGEVSTEMVLKAAQDWGLTNMVTELRNPDGSVKVNRQTGKPYKTLQLPTFFHIFIPVVMAYMKIRWGRLFAERDEHPLYRVEPAKLTMKSKVKCNIITDRLQMMVDQMGYRSDERQSIFQSLLYSQCLNFPREPWYREEQMIDGKKQIIKEGVRFEIPHPSRVFWDRSNSLASLNTDTGVEWIGYWDIVRWAEIMHREDIYWNLDKVTFGPDTFQWPQSSAWNIYQELYQCVGKWPEYKGAGGASESSNDRKDVAYRYSQEEPDSAVSITPIFSKIIPKEHGLYEYDEPVWHRFVFSNNTTVIHAIPFCYTPGVVYLYDNDINRANNSSLGLELTPWQDHLGNLLTQYILSVKQNLANLIMVNKDLVDEDVMKKIVNLGEGMFRSLNIQEFSGLDNRYAQAGSPQDAIKEFKLKTYNTTEISQAIMAMLTIMERMLGYSPQELGAAASHEQSATEMGIIAGSNSIRMQFTGGFIDDARQAKKKLLYDAMMAHSNDEIFAQVAEMNDAKRAALKDMGFEVEEEETEDTNAGVRGQKKGLMVYEGFASSKDGPKRTVDHKIAALMLQMFQSIFSNPVIVENQGLDGLVKMLNEILLLIGVPADFRVKLDKNKSNEAQAASAQEQMAAIAQEVVANEMGAVGQALREQLIEPLQQSQAQVAQALETLQQKDIDQDQAMQQLNANIAQIADLVAQATTPPEVPGVAQAIV